MDSAELKQIHFTLRQKMEAAATEKLQKMYTQQYDPDTMSSAKQDISRLLKEEAEEWSVLRHLQQQVPQ